MLKLFLVLLCFQLCYSRHNYESESRSIDSVFISWNKSTIASLERQEKSPLDTAKKVYYQNRLLAFRAYLGIKDLNIVDTNSIRYKFLKDIWKLKKASNFYVIEANSSGQKILLRSFLLYSSANSVNVDIYEKEEKWKKIGSFEMENFSLSKSLKDYFVKKGFNYEDIVITRFENDRLKESEYFLFGTLDLSSGIKNILDGYRKENFFSN